MLNTIYNSFYKLPSMENIIDDTIISVDKTWSSSKINSMIVNKFVTFNCDSSLMVGDLVFISASVNDTVETAIDHKSFAPVIGIAANKVTANRVEVLTNGLYTNLSWSFTNLLPVFVGADGKPALVKPLGGYVQVIGNVVNNNTIYFNTAITRVKQNPF